MAKLQISFNEVMKNKALQQILAIYILHGKISILKIPFELRISKKIYYIYAFRFYREFENITEKQAVLNLLKHDLLALNSTKAACFKAIYESYNIGGY
ncbi:MAG: hypothetical protein RR879_00040 [Hydrogenoanaerobacterium sp.]